MSYARRPLAAGCTMPQVPHTLSIMNGMTSYLVYQTAEQLICGMSIRHTSGMSPCFINDGQHVLVPQGIPACALWAAVRPPFCDGEGWPSGRARVVPGCAPLYAGALGAWRPCLGKGTRQRDLCRFLSSHLVQIPKAHVLLTAMAT